MSIPVVLLHTLSMTSAMWHEQRAALRLAGYLVLAPDQRGHGRVPLGDTTPSLDVVADDLARALDRRRIDSAVLVGSSMGGYVAMAFLRRHPGRVRGLALLGTRASADDRESAAGRIGFAERVVDPQLRPGLLAATTPRLVGATTRRKRPGVLARVHAMVERVDPAAIAWCQRAIAVRQDSVELLGSVDVPSVVIAGAEDELVPVNEAESLAATMPSGHLVTVPAAGHLTPLEAPAAVNAALADLLGRIGDPAIAARPA